MTPEIRDHLTAGGLLKKRAVIVNNFLGGLAWGVGFVIGSTIVIYFLFGFLRNFDWFLPGISTAIDQAQEQRTTRSAK